jgi:hypothetical protein
LNTANMLCAFSVAGLGAEQLSKSCRVLFRQDLWQWLVTVFRRQEYFGSPGTLATSVWSLSVCKEFV